MDNYSNYQIYDNYLEDEDLQPEEIYKDSDFFTPEDLKAIKMFDEKNQQEGELLVKLLLDDMQLLTK